MLFKGFVLSKIKEEWSESNKYWGMCVITALIVNDYFGGNICKIHVGDKSHYFNLLGSEIVDLKCEQFNENINYNNYLVVSRDIILTKNTELRYNELKSRLNEYLDNM